MSRNEVQKIKLLALYDFLCRETDENNPLSTAEIIERLKFDGIAVERKALINDIKVLNEWGYEVQSFKKKSFYYYVGYRKFDTAELRVLMDAVQAARFINENKTVELCEKIAELAGKNNAEILNKTVVYNNTVKHDNKNLFYTVDVISRAIDQKIKISFDFFDVLDKCDEIFLVQRRGGISQWREYEFTEELMERGMNSVVERIKIIEPPIVAVPVATCEKLVEQWKWNEFGDAIRNLTRGVSCAG